MENIQSPTNSFMLLLLSFANLAWFCSTNVPKTNTMIRRRNFFISSIFLNLQSENPNWGLLFQEALLMRDRNKVVERIAAKSAKIIFKMFPRNVIFYVFPIHVDVWRGWTILSHWGGLGGLAIESLNLTMKQKNSMIILSIKLAYSIEYGSV